MKNARIWFEKRDECKYISHLDLNRVMMRAIQKSKLPVWYTEGFNIHPYITFALPLSLGFVGVREPMDCRIEDDNFDFMTIPELLNPCLPNGIKVISANEPKYKAGDISSAEYKISLVSNYISNEELYSSFTELLKKDEILIEKKTKKGVKTVNLKEQILSFDISNSDKICLTLVLPCGSTNNVNPNLLIKAYENAMQNEVFAEIIRTDIFVEGGSRFE
ncbi:MAG: TIGR03936 family radical SAM-associated protein [Oscillospiraceae bacterium]|nr:TIGR03936 family radical SAM-associated protein [Candidatus Ruminococcus equi]